MARIRFYDPMALTDIASGLLVFFTHTPVPEGVAQMHAAFLIFKGVATMLPFNILPQPVFYLGGFADLISAAILFTGHPPVMAQYNKYIAGFLLLKGVWSSFSIMKYL